MPDGRSIHDANVNDKYKVISKQFHHEGTFVKVEYISTFIFVVTQKVMGKPWIT